MIFFQFLGFSETTSIGTVVANGLITPKHEILVNMEHWEIGY